MIAMPESEGCVQRIEKAVSRTDQVYTILLESICDCTLEPNARIVQEDLAASLGVSRQPIQQALQLLRADGLLIEAEGRGLMVAPLDASLIEQHYQIRIQMDRLAARLVAERARADGSRDFCRQLERDGLALIAQGQAERERGQIAQTVKLDVQFHSLIYAASGNSLIERAAAPHWNFLQRVMQRVLLHAGRGETVWREHEEILQLLLSGDHAAEAAVEIHIIGAQKALIAMMQRQAQGGAGPHD